MYPLFIVTLRPARLQGPEGHWCPVGGAEGSIAVERKVRQKIKSSRCLQLIEPSLQPWFLVKGHDIHIVRPSRAGYNEGLCFWAFCHGHFGLKNKSP